MYDYTAAQWLLVFYVYCFCGWIFESIVVSVTQHHLVNRGFLHGPMLPIYGFGATIMLHVALPLHGRPVAIYVAGMLVATLFEYFVGWLMETIFKVKYWDYSEHRCQFRGRICLQSSLAWGALSLSLVYVLHRPVVYLLLWLSPVQLVVSLSVVSAAFAYDVVDSVRTALDLAKMLEEMEKMRVEVNELREQFANLAFEKTTKLTDAAAEQREALSAAVADTRESLSAATEEARRRLTISGEESRLQLHLAIQEAEDRITKAVRQMKASRKWTVRGNPTLRAPRFDAALEDLKRYLDREKRK